VARTERTISHDLGGVINVIRGSADLARMKLEPNHPAAPDIARVIRACENLGALAMELRALTLLERSASV
jgi:signal transduction histidine kinase